MPEINLWKKKTFCKIFYFIQTFLEVQSLVDDLADYFKLSMFITLVDDLVDYSKLSMFINVSLP